MMAKEWEVERTSEVAHIRVMKWGEEKIKRNEEMKDLKGQGL